MQIARVGVNMNIWLDATVSVSGVTSHTPLPSLPMCLHPLTAESCGGGTTVSTFPLSCREHSFVSCIPFPIHLFLSLSPPGQKKTTLLLLFTRGRGLSVYLINLWEESAPPPPSFPPRFTWLVKQQSSKKRRRKRRCILSLPLAVSQCVSCCLFLMTG